MRRLLSHKDAADYCGMSVPHFDAHIARHVAPLAFGAKQLWDRRSLDDFIDRLGGREDSTTTGEWLERLG